MVNIPSKKSCVYHVFCHRLSLSLSFRLDFAHLGEVSFNMEGMSLIRSYFRIFWSNESILTEFGDMDWNSIHNNLYFFPNFPVFSIIQVIVRLEGCIWSTVYLCRTSFLSEYVCSLLAPYSGSLTKVNSRMTKLKWQGANLWHCESGCIERVACYRGTLMWPEKDSW